MAERCCSEMAKMLLNIKHLFNGAPPFKCPQGELERGRRVMYTHFRAEHVRGLPFVSLMAAAEVSLLILRKFACLK